MLDLIIKNAIIVDGTGNERFERDIGIKETIIYKIANNIKEKAMKYICSVHPRYYGTYPRILGQYVRDKKIMSLEEAIKKSTMLPAQKMQLKRCGEIKEGYYADITIFDPDKVIDVGTFNNPHQYPEGIEYVIVNGTVVIEKSEHTNKLPGKVLNSKID